MKLISMVDYVLEQEVKLYEDETGFLNDRLVNIFRYANFLKKPLELGMFIPCDEDGNVLEDPELTMLQGDGETYYSASDEEFKQYWEAEERVLFDGFQISDIFDNNNIGIHSCSLSFSTKNFKAKFENKTIKELIHYDITLTESAINKITNRKV